MDQLTQKLTAARLRELLDCDPERGEMRWKVTRGRAKKGELAGCIQRSRGGYRMIRLDMVIYYRHRLMWLYVHDQWPTGDLDHHNGQPGDDRIDNLRPATDSQNQANSRRHRDNKSGFKGVTKGRNGQWAAKIRFKGTSYYLGSFKTIKEAHNAYCHAATQFQGKYARVK